MEDYVVYTYSFDIILNGVWIHHSVQYEDINEFENYTDENNHTAYIDVLIFHPFFANNYQYSLIINIWVHCYFIDLYFLISVLIFFSSFLNFYSFWMFDSVVYHLCIFKDACNRYIF